MSAFDDLQAVIFQWRDQGNLMIKPKIFRRAKGPNYCYRLQFVDESDPKSSQSWYNLKFEDCMQWTEKSLKTWPDCYRKTFDTWDFKQRRDAEKFITVFHLAWPQ